MNLNAPVLLFAECNTCNCWDKMPPKLMVMKNNNLVFTVSTQCVFKFNWKRKHFDASKVSSIWDQIKLNFVSFLVRFDKNVFKGQNYFNRDISEVNGHGFESSDRNTENEARNDKLESFHYFAKRLVYCQIVRWWIQMRILLSSIVI